MPYSNKIIDWIEMLSANGMYVSWSLVMLMACNLCNNMNVPGCTKHASLHVVDWFLKAHGISIHAVSIKTNRDASILKSDTADFMIYACIVVNQESRDKQSIINMDQPPLLMSMHPDWTLTLPNKADIVAWTSTCNRKNQCISLLVTVTATGNCLKPCIVHKAKPGGLVERKAIHEFDD